VRQDNSSDAASEHTDAEVGARPGDADASKPRRRLSCWTMTAVIFICIVAFVVAACVAAAFIINSKHPFSAPDCDSRDVVLFSIVFTIFNFLLFSVRPIFIRRWSVLL